MSDIAIAHDQFRTIGGAERVVFEIARALDCPIYAMRVDESLIPDDIEVINLSSSIGKWLMHRHWLVQDAYQFFSWQHQKPLYEYDTVIITKNNPMWWVPDVDSQTVVRYCHSPPRGMFDQFKHRGKARKVVPIFSVQRLMYGQTTPYADVWLCNSEIVKRRVHRYLDPSDARVEVLYPPVDTSETSPDMAETGDYLFHVGRLAGNKRIGLLRDAAAAVDHKVVVAGDGPYRDELLENKPDNLEYIGYISEAEKWRRLSEAKGTLMLARSEDFGIVPIESMAAGTPVIGVAEGYTQHQIKDGRNGHLCKPTTEQVTRAIDELYQNGVAWSDDTIADFADQFSTRRFRSEITEQIQQTETERQIEPEHMMPIEREVIQ